LLDTLVRNPQKHSRLIPSYLISNSSMHALLKSTDFFWTWRDYLSQHPSSHSSPW
jgi:hypothetical protein